MEHIQCLIVDDEIPLAESTVEYFNLFEVSSEAVFDAESCLAFLRTHGGFDTFRHQFRWGFRV